MNLHKKIISGILCLSVSVSLIFSSFAKADSIYAPQNDLDGAPFQALQLGDWSVDSQGNYNFIYSVAPFKHMTARDKGLIPYSKQYLFDNPSKWAEYEVVKAAKMGLSNMDFITQYQDDITREEFARAIVQAYYKYDKWLDGNKEIPSEIETDIFNDVDVDKNPDDLALIHAYYLGIIQGWDGDFHGSLNITRQDMATIIGRFVELYKVNFLTNKDLKNYYADYKEVSSYAKKYVAGLSNDKIFMGYPVSGSEYIGKDEGSNYIFLPKTNTTNEQALCLILRSVEKYLDPQVTDILGTTLNAKIDEGSTNFETAIAWNAVYGADTYDVIQRKWTSDTVTTLQKSTRTQTNKMELEVYDENGYPTCALGSGVYDFTIQPFNEFNMGFESNSVRVIVPHPVEKASIQLVDNGDETADLSWGNVAHFDVAGGDDDKGATRYRIVIKEKGTNKVLEDKFITEDESEDRTNMTLNEGLVNNVGEYTILIYAYNEDFASAPVSDEYKVSEEIVDGETNIVLEEINPSIETQKPTETPTETPTASETATETASPTSTLETRLVPKVHYVEENVMEDIPTGFYPIYSLNGNEFAFLANGVYYRLSDNKPMTHQPNIDKLEPVMVEQVI